MRRIRSPSGGSTASARTGRPSVAKMTSTLWTAVCGRGLRRQRSGGHQQDPADVRGEQEHQVLADIGEDDATFLDGGHDGGEVVVEERPCRRLLADVGTRDPQGAADFGLHQRRRVADAIAGHRRHVAAPPPGRRSHAPPREAPAAFPASRRPRRCQAIAGGRRIPRARRGVVRGACSSPRSAVARARSRRGRAG